MEGGTTASQRGAQSAGEQYPCVMGQCLGQANLTRSNPQVLEATFQLQEMVLQRLVQESGDSGAKLLVVIIPTKLQVEPEDDQESINAVAAMLDLEGDNLHFDDQVVERIVRLCRDNQIAFVDAGPALRQAAQDGATFYWRPNWHLNVEGNALVAEQIYDYLQAHPQLLEGGHQ